MTKKLFLILTFSIIFFGCALPKIYYFEAKPFIEAYKEKVNKNLTINFGEALKDSFAIKTAGLKDRDIRQFRKSLESSLKNTFEGSYNSVNFSNTTNKEGISLLIVKMEPSWVKKTIQNTVTGTSNNVQTYTKYELAAKISYQVIVYSNGSKIKVIEKEVLSDKSTFKAKEDPEILMDGIKVMCQELYKEVINIK